MQFILYTDSNRKIQDGGQNCHVCTESFQTRNLGISEVDDYRKSNQNDQSKMADITLNNN